MMVPPSAAANSTANADLPLAVGPAIRMTGARTVFPHASSFLSSARNDGENGPSLRGAPRPCNLGGAFEAVKEAAT
jgi:hypothetical protein